MAFPATQSSYRLTGAVTLSLLRLLWFYCLGGRGRPFVTTNGNPGDIQILLIDPSFLSGTISLLLYSPIGRS
ncbi:hypothetical protein F5148DRAFT_1219743 [Russula earlei]|uniref:Uncharacterized protein n=1 Tax=Russula earlei TaxID=71964 RepID=A0ACC0U296_9AGAM|nr:hypothetical protein F5148DRAFT_1219743 [Russula earlei]